MELRKIVWLGIGVVGVTTLASSASLIGITTYLHRLTTQIDSNLQSVRATQEIEVQLLPTLATFTSRTLPAIRGTTSAPRKPSGS